VRVPEEAGDGVAQVKLTFADWKDGNVKAATITVALAAGNGKAAKSSSDDPK